MKIHISYICEGSSDRSLLGHLEDVLVELGATEVSGDCPDFSRLNKPPKTLSEKIKAVVNSGMRKPDIICVHRDADKFEPEVRRTEIYKAAEGVCQEDIIVPVVPVRAIEAWLLVDADRIKLAAGVSENYQFQNFPKIHQIENLPNPKKTLFDNLLDASGLIGRRRDKYDRFSARHYLLQSISSSMNLERLTSYRAMKSDMSRAFQFVAAAKQDA